MSHLGSRVSALLDGRLAPEEEERCWAHVHHCHPCRDLVEREGWVKTRLARLSLEDGHASEAPEGLKSALLVPGGRHPRTRRADSLPGASRHRGALLLGGGVTGAVGAAVVGVLALGLAPGTVSQVERRAPVTDLARPTATTSVEAPRRHRRPDDGSGSRARERRHADGLPVRRHRARERMGP